MLALTKDDIDFENNKISITKDLLQNRWKGRYYNTKDRAVGQSDSYSGVPEKGN